jgi:hypothetical protein
MSSIAKKFNEKYFAILEDYFGVHYEKMKKNNWSVSQATTQSRKVYSEKLANNVLDSLFGELKKLDWQGVETSLRRQQGTKCLIESPCQPLVYLRRLSLYIDSVVMAPIIAPSTLNRMMNDRPTASIFRMIACALELMEIKDLFFADIQPPIVTLIEPFPLSEPEFQKSYEELTTNDGIAFCSYIFGREFSSRDEIEQFLMQYRTVDELCKNIRNPEFFTWPNHCLEDDFKFSMDTIYDLCPHLFQGPNDAKLLAQATAASIFGRFGLINSQLFSCGALDASPVEEHALYYRRLLWKFQRDNEIISRSSGIGISRDVLVMTALQLENFRWLGNVPIEGIVKMRKEGELQHLRDILSRGVADIRTADSMDFVRVARQVSHNINQAFILHRTQIKRLDEEYRRKYDFDVASLLVTGVMGVASALFPPLAMVAGVIGGGSTTKIISDILDKRTKSEELSKKPVALLFDAYQDSEASFLQPSRVI